MDDIIRRVQQEVAAFEDPISWLLAPCEDGNEVESVAKLVDPIQFAAEVYNLVRRVEAAAAKHAKEDEPRIRRAAERVRSLTGPIAVMRVQVEKLQPATPLEKAGKAYLMERFGWALWILQERLDEWEY